MMPCGKSFTNEKGIFMSCWLAAGHAGECTQVLRTEALKNKVIIRRLALDPALEITGDFPRGFRVLRIETTMERLPIQAASAILGPTGQAASGQPVLVEKPCMWIEAPILETADPEKMVKVRFRLRPDDIAFEKEDGESYSGSFPVQNGSAMLHLYLKELPL